MYFFISVACCLVRVACCLLRGSCCEGRVAGKSSSDRGYVVRVARGVLPVKYQIPEPGNTPHEPRNPQPNLPDRLANGFANTTIRGLYV